MRIAAWYGLGGSKMVNRKTGVQARGKSVRDQVLEVATRHLASKGFEGTSLQDICDEVGIRKPSLLHHFPSKEILRRSVLENIIAHWNVVLPRLILATTSGRGQYEAVTREMVRFFREDPDRARLILRQALD